MYEIYLKRVYSRTMLEDGARVLVDRLWPRGKRRENLSLAEWYRDASPSRTLRNQWHRNEIDDATFARCYRDEISHAEDCLVPLMRWCRQGRLTLLSASRNLEQSHLPILREAILEALYEEDRQADGEEPSSPPCYAAQLSRDCK
ncbi:DUF488 domain-containing protein [Phytohalomonas tamaricis]|uniref:DUF488 domain-containing protein n=1 Tax=Phytohalomonas tamaricis TaxID=2081032 RepID=UPI000D0ACFDF|nr:DUF488 family protein [Phytohalomonas tamaricis]